MINTILRLSMCISEGIYDPLSSITSGYSKMDARLKPIIDKIF